VTEAQTHLHHFCLKLPASDGSRLFIARELYRLCALGSFVREFDIGMKFGRCVDSQSQEVPCRNVDAAL
jgi:hypothetical protein